MSYSIKRDPKIAHCWAFLMCCEQFHTLYFKHWVHTLICTYIRGDQTFWYLSQSDFKREKELAKGLQFHFTTTIKVSNLYLFPIWMKRKDFKWGFLWLWLYFFSPKKQLGQSVYFLIEKVRFSIQGLGFFSEITRKHWSVETFLLQNLLQFTSLKMFG